MAPIFWRKVFLRIVVPASLFAACFAPPLRAQTAAINDIKGKIFDAKMAQQTFAAGLKHCSELNGTTFYMQQRDRVLNLEEYHRSLDNLVANGAFNPETKQPWNKHDADVRWDLVKKEAASDVTTCALVKSLPDLQKKLDDLQRQAATPQTTPPSDGK
jgi:hypothetical protein